ncbi:hypothetical protein AYO38_09735 [bacterium SCGC AG-212-C10]|nr:hypothetical protein AYO38_09735 [bacterium SCGC AG-212-C10]
MANTPNVIYLPPGVTMPPGPAVPGGALAAPGVPFDRTFFERILPQAIAEFCKQVECDSPRLELLTVDGATHFVNGISGVTDTWVALQESRPEHDHVFQVFVPYQTIFRVEVHRESDAKRRHLGFHIGDRPSIALPAALTEAKPASEESAPKATARRKSTRAAAKDDSAKDDTAKEKPASS